MQLIKRTVIIALLILGGLLGFSLFLPRKISIARAVELPIGSECPSERIAHFSNWHQWFPALKSNISTIEVLSDSSAILKNNFGMETQLKALSSKPDSLVFHLSSGNSNPVEMVFMLQTVNNNHTVLHLVVNTELEWYPWQRLRGIFMDKVVGPQYEEVLENIRKACVGSTIR